MNATDRYLRWSEVRKKVALSRSTVDARIKAGTFPAKHDLGGNCKAWRESEIADWMSRPAEWRAPSAQPGE